MLVWVIAEEGSTLSLTIPLFVNTMKHVQITAGLKISIINNNYIILTILMVTASLSRAKRMPNTLFSQAHFKHYLAFRRHFLNVCFTRDDL